MIFAAESPRRVDTELAAEVLADTPESVARVGVFVNAEPGEIDDAVAACGLTVVQLHGEESPGDCHEVSKRTGCRVIKAVRVASAESIDGVVQFDTDYVLLDTYHPGQRGGTGSTFDWALATRLPAKVRRSHVIVSGGLGPENAAGAISVVAPFAIDISSGIESAPGIKDPESMERLFANLRRK